MTTCSGTPLYQAPEILRKEEYTDKCDLYNKGVSFFDVPKFKKLCPAALKQIEYYNRPDDVYLDKDKIKE